jgi:translation initiation factor 5B
MSSWIGQVDDSGQPKHAVTVILIFGATILCTILPSQVAFTSLVSAGGVPTIAAYGLIALLRFTMTPDNFKSSYFFLGRFRKLYYFVTVLFNGLIVAVRLSTFPGPGFCSLNPFIGHGFPFLLSCYCCHFQFCQSHFHLFLRIINLLITCAITQASVIFGAITVFGFLSWYFTPPENWLRREQVVQALQASN